MKLSDLPAVESIIVAPPSPVPEEEIERINNLIAGMRRQAKQIFKDAIEVGGWFIEVHQKLDHKVKWFEWLKENFPKVSVSSIWNYQNLARNREFLSTFSRDVEALSIREAIHLIKQQRKMNKPRVRAIVVKPDAEPAVLLEAKLKNYVINLWMLRYLQTEIDGMLLAMQLKPDQVLKILRYVCKEHHEVEEEVLRTFSPKLKVLRNGS